MNEIEFHYSIRSDLPACVGSPVALGAKFIDTSARASLTLVPLPKPSDR